MTGPVGTEPFHGTERFEVRRQLGEGGMGVVYEAWDREMNARVALKTLFRIDPAGIFRLKQEFRALADVAHENLVTLYELVSAEDRWFFTMELLDGVSLLDYVRGDESLAGDEAGQVADTMNATHGDATIVEAERTHLRGGPQILSYEETMERADPETAPRALPERTRATMQLASPVTSDGVPLPAPPPLDQTRLRSAVRQLVAGVSALHAAGKLHRDLKPSNVFVVGEGRVVLLDFGLVSDHAPRPLHATVDQAVVGTPAYMSPEQAAGEKVGPATDWYAVGVMLFEAITGTLPFEGRWMDIMAAKQTEEAPRASSLVSGVAPELDELCAGLLSRDATRRPTGVDILRALGEAPLPTPALRTPSSHQLLVGRERHMGTLQDAFDVIRTGRPVIAYVHGTSGMGKSELVQHFLEGLVRDDAAVVLTGRCYERESVPYKAVDSVIDSLSARLRRLPQGRVEALLPRDVGPLARLFPVLSRVEAVAKAPRREHEVPDPHELRLRAFRGLRELLARMADRNPLVVYIDDLQWGDADSAALLAELLRPPEAPAMLLIGSYRSDEAGTSPLLQRLLGAPELSRPKVDVRDVVVGPLSRAESMELALGLFQRQDAQIVPIANAIAKESEGSPFFVGELVRYLLESDADPVGSSDSLDIKLDEVLSARLSRLTKGPQRLLETVAVAGRPVGQSIAFRAATLVTDELAALGLLRGANLVRTRARDGEDALECYHDRIREVALARLNPDQLRDAHARIAFALEQTSAGDAEALAVHFHAAGDTQKAARYSVDAARKAAGALAFDQAVQLYRLALELNPGGPNRLELEQGLADALANAGRGEEAGRAYLQAAERADGTRALELRRQAAEQFLISGHIDEGLAVLGEVLAAVDMKLAKTPQRALASLAYRRAQVRLRGMRYQLTQEAELDEETRTRINICWSCAGSLGMVDLIRAQDFQARHLLLALEAGEPFRLSRALAAEAAFVSSGGGPNAKRSGKLVKEAESLAHRVDEGAGNRRPHAIALAHMAAGIRAFCLGRWLEGAGSLQRSVELLRSRCTGVAWELSTCQGFIISCLFYLGRFSELRDHVTQDLKNALDRGDLYQATTLRSSFGEMAWLTADDVSEARRQVSEAVGGWSRRGFQMQHYWALRANGYIDLYSGDAPLAWTRLGEAWAALDRSLLLRAQVPKVQMHQLRGNAALETWRRDRARPAALLKTAESDANIIAKERMSWTEPIAALLRAGIAVTRGHPEQALPLLEQAETGFDAGDMSLYAAATRWRRGELVGGDTGQGLVARARRELVAHGVLAPLRMVSLLAPGLVPVP